jgi:hypothetical protein
MEDANVVAGAGSLLDLTGHEQQRLHGRVVFRLGIGDTEFARIGGGNGDGGNNANGRGPAEIPM